MSKPIIRRKIDWKRTIADYALITFGTLALTAALDMFLVPNHIAPGGVSGIATILNFAFGWPVGLLIMALNVPLFILAFIFLGGDFTVKSLYSTFLLSVAVDYIPFPLITAEPFLCCVYGGVIMGAGLGIVYRGNGSTGGTDLAARLLHKKYPQFGIGWLLLALDALVALGAMIIIGPDLALFGIVALFLSSKVISIFTEGTRNSRAFMVVTDKEAEIARRVMNELKRGVTTTEARGQFTGRNKRLLICVVDGASEVSSFKRIVKGEDASAFMIITDAREVIGLGFREG